MQVRFVTTTATASATRWTTVPYRRLPCK